MVVGGNCRLVDWLQTLVNASLNSASFKKQIKIGELNTSATTYTIKKEGFNKCDRFVLYIPYATETLKWYFVFSWCNRKIPPLFGFNDELFKPEYSKIQALINWDSDHTDSFVNLIIELLKMYKEYQLTQCKSQERLRFELDNLEPAQYYQNMEIMRVRRGNTSLWDTVFLFKLIIDQVKELPQVYIMDSIIDNIAIVIVKYRYSGDQASAELKLSDFLSSLFTGKNALKLPSFSCLLSEYVENIREMIVNSVYAIGECFKFRKNFLLKCIEVFKHLIDGDFTYWTRVAFLIYSNDFLYILHVKFANLSSLNPVIDLQSMSVYHDQRNSDSPFAERITWKFKQQTPPDENSVDEMVEDLFAYVEEYGEKFQRSSCTNGV